MTSKADFTPEEWSKVLFAPLNTSLMISLASPSGPVGMIQEMYAAVASIVEIEKDAGASQILKDIVTDTKARQEKLEVPKFSSIEEGRAQIGGQVKEAIALIDAKAGADAPAIKQWLYGVAEKAAKAAKEGGFLGFGGTEVTPEETAALAELAGLLGVTPAA
jgi:hypothetical protein